MLKKLTPAKYVIFMLGGVRATGRLIGRCSGTVCKWKLPKIEGGTGGFIPTSARRLVLEYAKKHNIDITSQDLDYGRTVDIPDKPKKKTDKEKRLARQAAYQAKKREKQNVNNA